VELDARLRPGTFFRTGHRGARGLAPENTLAAFSLGAELGVDIMELDIRATSDGEIVVLHDSSIDRTTDGTGEVAELSWEQLSTFDAGYRFTPDDGASHPFRGQGIRVPRLQDVLNAFPEHAFTVELKPSPLRDFVARAVAVLRDRAPTRTILASAEHGLLRAARREAPEMVSSSSGAEVRNFALLTKVGLGGLYRRSPGRVFQAPPTSGGDVRTGVSVVTPYFVRAAHRGGRCVQVWTINDPDEMRAFIAMGVDGITTDRPDVLNDVLDRR